MKLDMQILADELNDICIEKQIKDRPEDKLASVRMLRISAQSIVPEYVYVSGSAELAEQHRNRNLSAVIYTGDSDIQSLQLYTGIDVMHVTGEPDDVFVRIQQIFERLSEWDERLNQAVMEHTEIQKIADIGAEVFNNPIAIFDSSITCLAKAGRLPEKECDNPIWRTLMKENHPLSSSTSSSAFARMSRQHKQIESIAYARKLEINGCKPFDFLAGYMYKNGQRIANVGMTEIWNPISFGEVSLCEHFISRLQFWARSEFSTASEEPAKQVVLNLLEGKSVPEAVINKSIAWMGRKKNSNICLACFSIMKSDERLGFGWETIVRHIEKSLVDLKSAGELVLVYGNTVIYIFHSTERNDYRKYIADINAEISKRTRPLLAGVGEPVSRFEEIGKAYYQAKAAVELGHQLNPDDTLFFFGDYAVECLLSVYLREQTAGDFCAQEILTLNDYDAEHGTQLMQTLEVYLLCDKNLTHAAQELHIHRNSLNYRIERIADLLGENEFTEIGQERRMHLILSSILLRSSACLQKDR